MLTKRLKICIATGAVLGVFCIVGAFVRSGFQSEAYLLFALWYNRLIMGLVIGLVGGNPGWPKIIGRGVLLSLCRVTPLFYFFFKEVSDNKSSKNIIIDHRIDDDNSR